MFYFLFILLDSEHGIKDNISTWIDSSHDHLNINKEDDFSFDDSAIALPTILNSPPDSVKSFSSNDDGDCSANFFEAEKSFDFVDDSTLIQPMKNSQDFLYPGPMAFHHEIETLSGESLYSINHNVDFIKTEDDMMIDTKTPIVGTDLMFSERQIPQIDFKEEIKTGQDINMNKMPVHKAPVNLLARRALNRPQIQLKIKMGPVLQNGNSNIIHEEPVQQTNTAVISTPQLINEILEKECDFDLVKYIDEDNVSK